jgi:hypothetical protein
MIEFSFDNCIESTVLADANNFYHKGIVPINSSLWCETVSKRHGRDVEEALLLYATLFPHAFHYVGEIENIKRNAI